MLRLRERVGSFISLSLGQRRKHPVSGSCCCCLFASQTATTVASSNLPVSVTSKMGRQLHRDPGHPLGMLKRVIEHSFPGFQCVDSLSPVVTVEQNFDELLVPADHVSRSPHDTYYLPDRPGYVLRCHTSAHQTELMRQGHRQFLCSGDVYRRDTVDRTHSPVFHQMEGVQLFDGSHHGHGADAAQAADAALLKRTLERLVSVLFGQCEKRWVDAYFPFTNPSFELEIFFRDQWLEVLGCGVIEPKVIENALGPQQPLPHGWAFGLGLERIAMSLFQIPDIRLFWTQDPRFRSQFSEQAGARAARLASALAAAAASGQQTADQWPAAAADTGVFEGLTFRPYSKYPPVFKDLSFWALPGSPFHEHEFYELVRDVAGDLVESVDLVDRYQDPTGVNGTSFCFRTTYRSADRSLTNEEIDRIQFSLRDVVQQQLKQIKLR